MNPVSEEFARPPRWRRWLAYGVIIAVAVSMGGALTILRPEPIPEDARPRGFTVDSLAEVATDLFQAMDGGIALTENEIKGRNTWMIWTGGNADFWNWLAQYGYGTNDLLKTLDSRGRQQRFREAGLINDPDFRASSAPDSFGLWLDRRVVGNDNLDARVYGRASGIVGLRIFDNPKFNRRKWDAYRYYNDANYYNNPKLERPYMVGMSCAFCHVGPHPLHPPADVENPGWANLSTNIGAQYFRTAKVFAGGLSENNLVYQILNAMADGTLDTSFLASDNILNPSNMNAIFEVGGRLQAAEHNPVEKMAAVTLAVPHAESLMHVPHILKDGADNVGIFGALARVYVNIGEFHDQWLRNHDSLVGGKAQTPFPVSGAKDRSIYWQSTEKWVDNLAAFFLKAAGPMLLEDAPGGSTYLGDESEVNRGKLVFANECASCHSSKQPPDSIDATSDAGKAWFRSEIQKPDFQQGNFFSDDRRHPVSEIKTNACRALATNAKRGHVWDNFSSETYKNSPPSGPIEVYNPYDASTNSFQPEGGGPGYYRTPSLVSIWATAPFFHNNQLGDYTKDPSVAGRLRAFNSASEQLLWPEKRRAVNSIMRTTAESSLQIPAPYLPEFLRGLADEDGYFKIGPVPRGTPLKLLANLDMTLETRELDATDARKVASLASLALKVKNSLLEIRAKKLDAQQSTVLLRQLVPELLEHSKCPDFIEDQGHYFGTTLPDGNKRALIEYLKTL